MRHEGKMDLRKHHVLNKFAELADGGPIEASVKISDRYRENYDQIDWSKKDDIRSKDGTNRAISDNEDSAKRVERRVKTSS